MTYSINIKQVVTSTLPLDHRTPEFIAYLSDVNTGMQFLNGNILEFINGSSYSYYNAAATYSLGQRINGGLFYNGNVFQCIGPTTSNINGAVLTSSLSVAGHGYQPNDIFQISGGLLSAQGRVLTVSAPIGLKINILTVSSGIILSTSLNSGGTGYSPGVVFSINGGFSLATATVLTVGAGGVVLTYSLGSLGTGYSVTSGALTTVSPLSTGNVLTYTMISPGYGYQNFTVYNTTSSGIGVGLKIQVQTVGGTPPPSNTNVWELINDNFIGVNERDLYTNNKLTLEWALNRWFNTTFRQPIGVTSSGTHSDIYIDDVTFNLSAFHCGAAGGTNSSFCYADHSSDWVTFGGYTTPVLSIGSNPISYHINFPKVVYYALPSPQLVTSFVNKYNVLSIPYQVITY